MIDELGVETVNWFTFYDNGDTGLWLERERVCVCGAVQRNLAMAASKGVGDSRVIFRDGKLGAHRPR